MLFEFAWAFFQSSAHCIFENTRTPSVNFAAEAPPEGSNAPNRLQPRRNVEISPEKYCKITP